MRVRPNSTPRARRLRVGIAPRIATALLFGLLGVTACQSGDGGVTNEAPVVAKAGATRASAFRDIGKRSASDLTLR